jgi:hypothetical protein
MNAIPWTAAVFLGFLVILFAWLVDETVQFFRRRKPRGLPAPSAAALRREPLQ